MTPPRTTVALILLGAVLLGLPLFVGPYGLSVLVLCLFAAYLGQSWNIMMGFAGQLSLGHALYVGLGAYAAAALFVHFGLLPWLGIGAGVAIAALAGAIIAALSFRFAVTGVYFALLTIAFDELTRVLFDHFSWVGGSAGLFLPVTTFAREDQAAAEALGINAFRYKLAAVTLSAALTAVAGGITAFYDNNLYPDNLFSTARSVEIIAAPIIGGLGTLFGPIVGAFLLTGLGEALTNLGADFGVPGLKQWFYGAALVAIVLLQPAGVWPWFARRLGLGEGRR